MDQLKFNLKQREIFVKLLIQAKDRAQVDLQSNSSFNERVEAKVALKLIQENGAEPLVEKLRVARKQVEDMEKSLQDLGFQCDVDSVSLRWDAPKILKDALSVARRAEREEKKKVLKKYDLAILDVWATEDVASAKVIVEKLL